MTYPIVRRALTLSLVLFALAGPAAPADAPKTFEDVLALVARSADSFTSWKAEMTMAMAGRPGMTMTMNGVMMGLGEMTASHVGTEAGGQTMTIHTVLDKDGIQWTEMDIGGRKQVMKMDSAAVKDASQDALGMNIPMAGGSPMAMSQNPKDLLAAYGEMYDMVVQGEGDVQGAPVYTLKGVIKPAALERLHQLDGIGLPEGDILVSVGQEDGFIRQLVLHDNTGNPIVTMTFKNVELNAKLDASDFDYTPPQGAQVMDMTPAIEGQLKAKKPAATTP